MNPAPVIEDEALACPTCGGDLIPLGTLGRLEWFRCQACGMEFNLEVVDDRA